MSLIKNVVNYEVKKNQEIYEPIEVLVYSECAALASRPTLTPTDRVLNRIQFKSQ